MATSRLLNNVNPFEKSKRCAASLKAYLFATLCGKLLAAGIILLSDFKIMCEHLWRRQVWSRMVILKALLVAALEDTGNSAHTGEFIDLERYLEDVVDWLAFREIRRKLASQRESITYSRRFTLD